MARTSELVHRIAEEVSARYCCFTRLLLHAYSYTHTLRRLLLHAYSYTPTLTRLLLHASSYTPPLTRLLSGWVVGWKCMTSTCCASSMRTPLAFHRTSIFTTRATPPLVRSQQVFFKKKLKIKKNSESLLVAAPRYSRHGRRRN
jgi:hypothetical protein